MDKSVYIKNFLSFCVSEDTINSVKKQLMD